MNLVVIVSALTVAYIMTENFWIGAILRLNRDLVGGFMDGIIVLNQWAMPSSAGIGWLMAGATCIGEKGSFNSIHFQFVDDDGFP